MLRPVMNRILNTNFDRVNLLVPPILVLEYTLPYYAYRIIHGSFKNSKIITYSGAFESRKG